MNFRFFHIEFIWLLLLVLAAAILFFRLMRWKKRVTRRIGDPELIQALMNNYSHKKFRLKFVLLLVALLVGVLAAMDLRRPGGPDGMNRKGIDVLIALDVSNSMLATDVAPSRLEKARQLINKLMNGLPNDRIGLVLFAGRAYLQMPLTTDHGAARMYINTAGPEAVPQQGTVVSEALTRSANAFNAAERRFKAVVLITDGEDHDEEAIKTAKKLASEGMMINTVGIGSPEGAFVPDPATGQQKIDPATGAPVISKLNETLLSQLAGNTNGIYVRLGDTDEAVRQLLTQLSQIESKAYGDVSLMNFRAYYWWFAGLMLILLLAEFLIPETKKGKT